MQDAFQGMRAYQKPRPSARPCSVASRLCAPSPDLKLANRELGTVKGIGQDGRMSLKKDGGRPEDRVVELYPATHLHLDHGYAVTSHSSQGQIADRVLIHVDTGWGAKDLLNNRIAYVAGWRGAYDVQLFTEHAAEMRPSLRSFIVSSMYSRNRHRVLAQIHLRKKGRRTRLLMPKGPVAAKLTEIAQLSCTVPTQQDSMELCSFESVFSRIIFTCSG